MKLSILMPVYNERATLASAVKEVLNVRFPCEVELVIVDDGSTDGTFLPRYKPGAGQQASAG